MERPRILLVPLLSELEWTIRPLLEEWAEVASYDGPGVGSEPAMEGLRTLATARRGLEEIDRRGWERCVVVGDEFGGAAAILLSDARPSAVAGLVLGHATVSWSRGGERPAINPAVIDAHIQLAEVDFRAFVKHDFRAWQGSRSAVQAAPEADELTEAYLRRVSHQTTVGLHRELVDSQPELEQRARAALLRLDSPLLLVRHEGCLVFTAEGYQDAVVALPGAATATTALKPTIDPAFGEILRSFCERAAREPAASHG